MGQSKHIRVAVAAYGPLPQPCWFCQGDVLKFGIRGLGGCVHHVDHNHDNNDPENLVFAHHTCHTEYHTSAQWRAGERLDVPQKVRDAWTPEKRAAQAELLRSIWRRKNGGDPAYKLRVPQTDEQRNEMYAKNGRRHSERLNSGSLDIECVYGCGKRCAPGPMKRHTSGQRCPMKPKDTDDDD